MVCSSAQGKEWGNSIQQQWAVPGVHKGTSPHLKLWLNQLQVENRGLKDKPEEVNSPPKVLISPSTEWKKMAILVPSAWIGTYNTGRLLRSIPKGILKIKHLHLTYRINGWAVFSCLSVGVFLEHLNIHKGMYMYLFWMSSHAKPSKVDS